MFFSNTTDHALITIYGDNEARSIEKAVSLHLLDTEIKILTPSDPETLVQAARNSVLVLIGLMEPYDKNLKLGRILQNDRLVVADILAFCLENKELSQIQIMAEGFDACLTLEDINIPEFKKLLASKIMKGGQRVAGLIREEEYRRLSDALSAAPVSLIIFDADKRAVYVSDHYFRAYPKIAPRLIRGLRVYDAFEMMVTEERIKKDDPRYEPVKQFWLNLEGDIEFSLDNGISYRLKATKLPSNRGTVITGQNITGYRRVKK